jgi:hypothetical protein
MSRIVTCGDLERKRARERERDGKHNFVIGISRALHYVVGMRIVQ